MTLRFKLGDLARIIILPNKLPDTQTNVGDIIEIAKVGPFAAGELVDMGYAAFRVLKGYDYIVHSADEVGGVLDSWLAPIGDPDGVKIETEEEADA